MTKTPEDEEIHFEYQGRFYQTTKAWIVERMQAIERADTVPMCLREIRDELQKLREYMAETF